MKRAFLIDVTYACFGIVSVDDKVTDAAPIAGWMIGKTLQQIKPWLLKKKAKVIELYANKNNNTRNKKEA